MPVKFEQNRMVQTSRNFESVNKNLGFLKPIFTKRSILEDVSVAETIA